MALAWYEGRKLATRRPMKPQPDKVVIRDIRDDYREVVVTWPPGSPMLVANVGGGGSVEAVLSVAMGPARIPGAGIARIGKRVWCRETFGIDHPGFGTPGGQPYDPAIVYRADDPSFAPDLEQWEPFRWRSSMVMPKRHSRSWGEIVSVRPCDLSGIDDAEAALEGFSSAEDLLDALSVLYPDARWFWRVGWKHLARPSFT